MISLMTELFVSCMSNRNLVGVSIEKYGSSEVHWSVCDAIMWPVDMNVQTCFGWKTDSRHGRKCYGEQLIQK